MSCSNSIIVGVGSSSGMEFPGYLKMELDDKEYNHGSEILLHASYGHDYIVNFNENNSILSNTIMIYTLKGSYSGPFEEPDEYIELYKIMYEGDELGSETYRCYPRDGLSGDIEYNKTIDLQFDFSEIDYDYGLLVMRFTETYISEDMVENVLVETETMHHRYAFVYFLKDDTTIEFSLQSFAK
jgi:hypothetical protein